jgi:energy-coupling factor transport system permease protein
MLTLTLIALVLLTTNDQRDIAQLAAILTRPLNIIGIKSYEISMMITLILHFIPVVFAETEKVILAQKARGARINEGNIIKRLRSFIPVLIPVFVSCIRKANKTSFAMEARCYGASPKRTSLRKFKMKRQDYFAIVVVLMLIIGVFSMNLHTNFSNF